MLNPPNKQQLEFLKDLWDRPQHRLMIGKGWSNRTAQELLWDGYVDLLPPAHNEFPPDSKEAVNTMYLTVTDEGKAAIEATFSGKDQPWFPEEPPYWLGVDGY